MKKSSPNLIAYYRDRCAPPLTQKALSRLLGVHINSIQRWETHGVPDPHHLHRLLDMFIEHGAIRSRAAGSTFWKRSGRSEFLLPPDVEQMLAQLPETAAGDPAPPLAAVQPIPGTFSAPLLPHPLTSLIGRDHDLARLVMLVRAHRLITITGPGGSGKTSLAIAAAHALRAIFREQIVFIELEHLTDHRLLIDTIGIPFGIKQVGSEMTLMRLVETLRRHPILLVLDTMEHLLDAAPDLHTLLQTTGTISILATSRTRLNINGEREYRLPPLELPDVHKFDDPAYLAGVPSVALFLERTQDVIPDVQPTPPQIKQIAAICRRLDGLPLAIELAAARMRIFTPGDLLARLTGDPGTTPLDELTSTNRILPTHRRTLRATIEWSYNLLGHTEQRLFDALAIFAGNWTTAAAEAICTNLMPGLLPDTVSRALETLRDSSLIQRLHLTDDDEARFQMLQVIRTYALERLQQTSVYPALAERYAEYYVKLAIQLADRVEHVHDRIALLEAEYDNLCAVLDWLIEHAHGQQALALCMVLQTMWDARGMLREGSRWIARVLPFVPPMIEEPIWLLLIRAMLYLHEQGEYLQAISLIEPILERQHQLGNYLTEAHIRQAICSVACLNGDVARGVEYHRTALQIYRQFGLLEAIHFTSSIELPPLAPEQATQIDQLREPQLAAHQALGLLDLHMHSVRMIEGLLALYRGDSTLAVSMLTIALADYTRMGLQWSVTIAHTYLGLALIQTGADAEAMLLTALRNLNERQAIAELLICLEGFIVLATQSANYLHAAALTGAITNLRERLSMPTNPLSERLLTPAIQAIHTHLTAEQFQHALDAGRSLSLEQTVAAALQAP